jgi:hypothetical protein
MTGSVADESYNAGAEVSGDTCASGQQWAIYESFERSAKFEDLL